MPDPPRFGLHGVFRIAILALIATALAQSGCRSPQPEDRNSDSDSPRYQASPYKQGDKIAPRAFESAKALLEQTAAIVEGEVFDVSHDYDDCAGPRTHVRMRDSRSLLGTSVAAELDLKLLGGPLPNGKWVEVSESPAFAIGARYVIFLRNTDWTYAPVLGLHAYRRQTIAGKDVLISQDGRAVTSLTDQGIEAATDQLTEPVGRHLRGVEQRTGSERPRNGNVAAQPAAAVAASSGNGSLEPKDGTSKVVGPVTGGDRLIDIERYGPSAQEIAASGRYSAPPLVGAPTLDAVRAAISVDQLVAGVRQLADREGVRLGGYLALDPLWRCWSFTPEPNLRGR